MNIGINVNTANLLDIKKLHGYDFLEISDFIFPAQISDATLFHHLDIYLKDNPNSVKCIQGPIRDIKPESGDQAILAITKERFLTLIDYASKHKIPYVLFHTTFDPLVRFDFYTDMWLYNNIAFWDEIIPYAAKKNVICIYSNVWDPEPNLLFQLFDHFRSSYFQFGFDLGHAHYISDVPIEKWFQVLGSYTPYILIHDNLGQRDDHLSLGQGNIDFIKIKEYIDNYTNKPNLCIQLFNFADMQKSLDFLQSKILRNLQKSS